MTITPTPTPIPAAAPEDSPPPPPSWLSSASSSSSAPEVPDVVEAPASSVDDGCDVEMAEVDSTASVVSYRCKCQSTRFHMSIKVFAPTDSEAEVVASGAEVDVCSSRIVVASSDGSVVVSGSSVVVTGSSVVVTGSSAVVAGCSVVVTGSSVVTVGSAVVETSDSGRGWASRCLCQHVRDNWHMRGHSTNLCRNPRWD